MGRDFAKINHICLIILASLAVTVSLIYTKTIMVPFVFSIFAFAVTQPCVRLLQFRCRIPKPAAIGLTFFAFLLMTSLTGLLIVSSLGDFIQGAGIYKERVIELSDSVVASAAQFGFPLNRDSIRSALMELPLLNMIQKITGGALSLFGNMFLILIFLLFLLAGAGHSQRVNPLIEEIQLKITKYVVTKLILSLATGVLVGTVLLGFGIDLAIMLALVTFLLNFIPSIGSIIATVLPIPLILLQYGFGYELVGVLILSLVIQVSIGNVLEPKLMGESMDLHPVAILLFLMFWGLVWGVPGMFLAVPITAILKIVLSRIESTRGLSELLAGRIR